MARVARTHDGVLHVALRGQLWQSTDGGATWQRVT